MTTNRIAITFILSFLLITPVVGQKRGQPSISDRKVISARSLDPEIDDLPKFEKFGYLISVSTKGDAKVELLSGWAETSWTVGPLSSVMQKKVTSPVVILKAEESVRFKSLKPWLDAFRGDAKAALAVRFDDGSEMIVPARVAKNRPLKPNPLFLMVTLKRDGILSLNGEVLGTLVEPGLLVNRLREVFKARSENGVLRVGSAEIDTTVFIKPDAEMTFGTLEKLTRELRTAGSDRVGLWLDADEDLGVELIQMVK